MTTLCGDTCYDPKLGNHTDLGSTSFALRPVLAEVKQHRKSGVLPVLEGTSSIYINLTRGHWTAMLALIKVDEIAQN